MENISSEGLLPTIDFNTSALRDDELLRCLEILCLQEHIPFSDKAITAGLPLVDNKLTPTLFERAASRAGFETKIIKRDLDNISNLVLPVILLLDDNHACILNYVHSEDKVEIILPETVSTPKYVTLDDLRQLYVGFAIFAQPIQQFEARAEEMHQPTKRSWFWGTLWRFRRLYVQSVVCSLMINLFILASPLFIMNVYDRVVPNYAYQTLWVLVSGITLIFVFDFIIRTSRSYLLDIGGQKIDVLIASRLFSRVLGMKLNDKPTSSGAFANDIREFDSLREFFTSATLTTMVDIPFVLLFIVIIFYIGGIIAFVPLLIAPLVMLAAYLLERPMRNAIQEARLGSTQKHAILVESISGLEIIKALSAEGIIQRRWERYVSQTAKAGLNSRFFSSLAVNITYLMQQMATVFVVLMGVYMIEAGNLTVGGLIACVILSGRALAPLAHATNLLTRLEGSKLALQSLNKIMTLPLERDENKKYLRRDKLHGDIEFENVSFKYPGQLVSALRNISFKIKAGEKVAFVGKIGSGKSSILKLILGLYQVNEGSIRIDGIDIDQIDPAELRAHIGYAPQENLLFYGSIRENIAMRDTLSQDGRILKVAKIAGVDDFVSCHPSGYGMNVGERGENISGGQRQAISIARAILPNISILMLDEPTSAIDQKSEKGFVDSLKENLVNETVIISTHRGGMLDLVDRIVYIEGGRVIADGPKDEIFTKLDRRRKS